MNNLSREKLKYIITQYGRSLADDPKRTEALLRDFCGQYRKEINVLISAMKEGVPIDLSNSQNSVPSDLLLARLTKKLEERLGLSQEAARWGVESWAIALGMISEGDERLVESSSPPPPVSHQYKQEKIDSFQPPAVTIDFIEPPKIKVFTSSENDPNLLQANINRQVEDSQKIESQINLIKSNNLPIFGIVRS